MKMKLRISLIALCVLVFVSLAQAYPSGSPKCSNHVPKHETNKAQTTPSPFKLTTSAVTKKDGKSTVTVTISSTDGTKFKGFFVYATTPDGNDKLGQFTKTDKTKVLKCGSAVRYCAICISFFDLINPTSQSLTICFLWTTVGNHPLEK